MSETVSESRVSNRLLMVAGLIGLLVGTPLGRFLGVGYLHLSQGGMDNSSFSIAILQGFIDSIRCASGVAFGVGLFRGR